MKRHIAFAIILLALPLIAAVCPPPLAERTVALFPDDPCSPGLTLVPGVLGEGGDPIHDAAFLSIVPPFTAGDCVAFRALGLAARAVSCCIHVGERPYCSGVAQVGDGSFECQRIFIENGTEYTPEEVSAWNAAH
jgi:hypothetical protein